MALGTRLMIIFNTLHVLTLHAAAFWGFANVTKTLLDSGCNVNHQNEGSLWTPLHAATFQEHGKVHAYPDCYSINSIG